MKNQDLMNQDLRVTGIDIPDGSYPGVLFGFTDTHEIPSNYPAPGSKRTVFEMRFAIKVKDSLQEVEYMLAPPEGDAANRKSNLYKTLKAMRGGDAAFFNNDGGFQPGIKLASFLGSPCTVQVTKNKKDFTQVSGVAAPMHGVSVPTLEECAPLLVEVKDSGDVPF